MQIFRILYRFILFISVMVVSYSIYADDFMDLSGTWLFKEGDRKEWSKVNWDDQDWEEIRVPKGIRDQGKFIGLESIGWYRFHFNWEHIGQENLVLALGQIFDADETWLNGVQIGAEGSIPEMGNPIYVTAYRKIRIYPIPLGLLKPENNLVSIRVKSFATTAGIVSGPVGIGEHSSFIPYAEKNHRNTLLIEFAIVLIYTLIFLVFNSSGYFFQSK